MHRLNSVLDTHFLYCCLSLLRCYLFPNLLIFVVVRRAFFVAARARMLAKPRASAKAGSLPLATGVLHFACGTKLRQLPLSLELAVCGFACMEDLGSLARCSRDSYGFVRHFVSRAANLVGQTFGPDLILILRLLAGSPGKLKFLRVRSPRLYKALLIPIVVQVIKQNRATFEDLRGFVLRRHKEIVFALLKCGLRRLHLDTSFVVPADKLGKINTGQQPSSTPFHCLL